MKCNRQAMARPRRSKTRERLVKGIAAEFMKEERGGARLDPDKKVVISLVL